MSMSASPLSSKAQPPFHPLPFRAPDIAVRRGEDGSVYLSSRTPLGPVPQSIPHVFDARADLHPDRPWLRQRLATGKPWRTISYGAAKLYTRGLAQGLLDIGLGPDAPVMILSGNSIEHALLSLAAQRIGAPAAPVSMAYSTMSTDFAKLKHCFAAIAPKAIFAQTLGPFDRALEALSLDGVVILTADGSGGSLSLDALARTIPGADLDTAMTWLGPDTVGKYLFTSGSTGMPKPAPQTQGAMCAQIAANDALDSGQNRPLGEELRVLDWMPWSHISGGNVNFNRCIAAGAVLHIDEGRPAPGLFQPTIANLKEVRPQYFGSAPIAFGMLAEAMEADPALRNAVFGSLQYLLYGGATLSDDLYERLQALSIAATGKRIPLLTMYGATETQGVTMTHWEIEKVGMIGLPLPGMTLKLTPVGAKLEVRVKGPTVMTGYLGMPEKNREAFDEEGFYRLGDAARFEDPDHPEKGVVFDGRVTEDFKLDSGTWVSVGTLRPALVAACAPLVFDAVICGQDKPHIGALIWPSPAGLAQAGKEAGPDPEHMFAWLHQHLEPMIAAFNASQGGSSRRIGRFRLLRTPPSLDAGEITDKGYVNQRVAQDVRASDVAALFA
jgi:feruloyl-CoA synthase